MKYIFNSQTRVGVMRYSSKVSTASEPAKLFLFTKTPTLSSQTSKTGGAKNRALITFPRPRNEASTLENRSMGDFQREILKYKWGGEKRDPVIYCGSRGSSLRLTKTFFFPRRACVRPICHYHFQK